MASAATPQPPSSLTADQALQQALVHHRAGRLQEAERLYRVILQGQPGHAEANHNLGLLALQGKQTARALALLKVALQANPAQTQYWASYIEALIAMEQIEAARQMLAQGRKRGLQGAALEALGARLEGPQTGAGPTRAEIEQVGTLFNQGRYAELEALARDLTARFHLNGLGWHALGGALKQLGRVEEALAPMQKAVALLPGDPGVNCNLGILLQDLGRLAEAEASYRRALELQPHFAEAHGNLGNALRDQGRMSEAEAGLRRALALKPDYAEAHNNLGLTLQAQGRLAEAEASYRRALALKPDYVEAYGNLGAILQEQRHLPEAEASLRRALELKPDYAAAHNNLGNTLYEQGRLSEAEASLRRALALKPDFTQAHFNLGNTLLEQGQLLESESSYRRVLELKPDDADAHHNFAILLLGSGRFAEGWKEFVWRIREQPKQDWPHLPWPANLLDRKADKSPPFNLRGARIALLKDQGLGDELFFLRFANELRKRGAWVAYVADRRIAPFIRRAQWVDCVAEEEEMIESVQVVLSVGDLPLVLGMTTLADIPPPVPLSVLPEQQQEIALRLAPHRLTTRPLIGITWRAGDEKRRKNALLKEIPPGELAAALRGMEASFVIVQRNPRPDEIAAFEAALGQRVLDFSDLNSDLEGMLTLMSTLDDYIGVSNTNTHLRASVGKTAHVLVPHKKDFRWMTDGDSSPWFPGFTVYRKTAGNGWDHALAQLRRRFIQE